MRRLTLHVDTTIGEADRVCTVVRPTPDHHSVDGVDGELGPHEVLDRLLGERVRRPSRGTWRCRSAPHPTGRAAVVPTRDRPDRSRGCPAARRGWRRNGHPRCASTPTAALPTSTRVAPARAGGRDWRSTGRAARWCTRATVARSRVPIRRRVADARRRRRPPRRHRRVTGPCVATVAPEPYQGGRGCT